MACLIGLLGRLENIIKVKSLVNFKQDVNAQVLILTQIVQWGSLKGLPNLS